MMAPARRRASAKGWLSAVSSPKFITFCIAVSMVLVFAGTIAQVSMGTFPAQKRFFNSWWVFAATPWGFRVPVLPGGLTVGLLWLSSLLASLFQRFKYGWKSAGLVLAHVGLILLLLGQFLTQTLARESQMPIQLGHTMAYAESTLDTELAVVEGSDPKFDQVVSIPYSRFSRPGEIKTPLLPFVIDVQRFYRNAQLTMASAAGAATQGVGARIAVQQEPPVSSDDDSNAVTAVVEIKAGGQSLGTWLLSSGLGAPQTVHVDGKDYRLYIRPKRYYFPFTLTLKDFRHDVYPGTDIPKNFSSLVRLDSESGHEHRDALIYMNHPLRYAGLTFYQASFGQNDTLSVLQVVRNPVWITPYLSCAIVILGLAIHFLMSLQAYSRRAA